MLVFGAFILFVIIALIITMSSTTSTFVLSQTPVHICNSNASTSTFNITSEIAQNYVNTRLYIRIDENCTEFTLRNDPGISLYNLEVGLSDSYKEIRDRTPFTAHIILNDITFPTTFSDDLESRVGIRLTEQLENSQFEFRNLKNLQLLNVNSRISETEFLGSENTIIIDSCSFHFSDGVGSRTRLIEFFYAQSPSITLDKLIFTNNVVTSTPRANAQAAPYPFFFKFGSVNTITTVDISHNHITMTDVGVTALKLHIASRSSFVSKQKAVETINYNNNTIFLTMTQPQQEKSRSVAAMTMESVGFTAETLNFKDNTIVVDAPRDLSTFGIRSFLYTNPDGSAPASGDGDDGSGGSSSGPTNPLSQFPIVSCSGVANTLYMGNTITVSGGHVAGITHRIAGGVKFTDNVVVVNGYSKAAVDETSSEFAPAAGLISTFFCFNYFGMPDTFYRPQTEACPNCVDPSPPSDFYYRKRKWLIQSFLRNKVTMNANFADSAQPYVGGIGVVTAIIDFVEPNSVGSPQFITNFGVKIDVIDNEIIFNTSSSQHVLHSAISLNANNIPKLSVGTIKLPFGMVTGNPSNVLIRGNKVQMTVNPRGFWNKVSEPPALPGLISTFIEVQTGTTVETVLKVVPETNKIAFALASAQNQPPPIGAATEKFRSGVSFLTIQDNNFEMNCVRGKGACLGLIQRVFASAAGAKTTIINSNFTIHDHRPNVNDGTTSCNENTANAQISSSFIRTEAMPYYSQYPQRLQQTISRSHFLLKTLPTTCPWFISKYTATKNIVAPSYVINSAQKSHVETTDMINQGSSFLFDFGRNFVTQRKGPSIKNFFSLINPIDHNFPPKINFNITDESSLGQMNSCSVEYTDCRFTPVSVFDGLYSNRYPSMIADGSWIDTFGFKFTHDLEISDDSSRGGVPSRQAKLGVRKCPAYFPPTDPTSTNYQRLPVFAQCKTPQACSLRFGCLFQNPADLFDRESCQPGMNGIEVDKVNTAGWKVDVPVAESAQRDACYVTPPKTNTRELTESILPACPPAGEVLMQVEVKPYNGNKYPIAELIEITFVEANSQDNGVPQIFINTSTNETFISVAPASSPGGSPSDEPGTSYLPLYYGFSAGAEDLKNIKVISKAGPPSSASNSNDNSNDPFSDWNRVEGDFSERPYDHAEQVAAEELPDGSVEFKVNELRISQRGNKATLIVSPPGRINKKLTAVASIIAFSNESLNCRVTSVNGTGPTSWISPVIELPRQFSFVSTAVVEASLAVVTATTFAAGALGGGGGVMASMAARRYLTAGRVFECTESGELAAKEYDFFDHPLGFAVGGSYAVGALLGNFLLTLGAHLIVFALYSVRKFAHRQDVTEAKIWAGYPDVTFSIATLVLHGTVVAMTQSFVIAHFGLPDGVSTSVGGHIAAAVILTPICLYALFVMARAIFPPSLFRLRAKAFPTYLILQREEWKKEQKQKKKKEMKEEKKKQKERLAKIARGEDIDEPLLAGASGTINNNNNNNTTNTTDPNKKKKGGNKKGMNDFDGNDGADEIESLGMSDFEDEMDEEDKRRKRMKERKKREAEQLQKQQQQQKGKDPNNNNNKASIINKKSAAALAQPVDDDSDSSSDEEEEPGGCCASMKTLLLPWVRRENRWRDVLKGSRFVERYAAGFEDCSAAAFTACYVEIALTTIAAILEGLPAETGTQNCSFIAMFRMLVASLSFILGILRPYCVRLLNIHAIAVNLAGVTSLMLQVVSRYQGGQGNDTAMELADLAIFIIFYLSIIPIIWMVCSYSIEPSIRMRRLKRMIKTCCAKPPDRDDDYEDKYGEEAFALPNAGQIIPLNKKKKQAIMKKIQQRQQSKAVVQEKMAEMMRRLRERELQRNGENDDDDVELLGINSGDFNPDNEGDAEYLDRLRGAAGSLRQLTAEERERIRKSSIYKDVYGKVASAGMVDEVLNDKKAKRSSSPAANMNDNPDHHQNRDDSGRSGSRRSRSDRHHHRDEKIERDSAKRWKSFGGLGAEDDRRQDNNDDSDHVDEDRRERNGRHRSRDDNEKKRSSHSRNSNNKKNNNGIDLGYV